MSIALVLIGLVILVIGLPWLAAAIGFFCWALTRCCASVFSSRVVRPPAF